MFKLPVSLAFCSSYFLILPGVDSSKFESVLKFFLFLFSFLSLASMWDEIIFSMNSRVVAATHRTPSDIVTLISLLMVSSLTKPSEIVKNLFLLRLAPRTKIFKSRNAY